MSTTSCWVSTTNLQLCLTFLSLQVINYLSPIPPPLTLHCYISLCHYLQLSSELPNAVGTTLKYILCRLCVCVQALYHSVTFILCANYCNYYYCIYYINVHSNCNDTNYCILYWITPHSFFYVYSGIWLVLDSHSISIHTIKVFIWVAGCMQSLGLQRV